MVAYFGPEYPNNEVLQGPRSKEAWEEGDQITTIDLQADNLIRLAYNDMHDAGQVHKYKPI